MQRAAYHKVVVLMLLWISRGSYKGDLTRYTNRLDITKGERYFQHSTSPYKVLFNMPAKNETTFYDYDTMMHACLSLSLEDIVPFSRA